MISLDLLSFQPFLKIKKEDGQQFIFCPIRNKYLVLQPEELVRQLLLLFFIKEKKYAKSRIAVEKLLIINDLRRRFDILIYDKHTKPFLLIECKAPKVKITQSAFEQVAQYNLALQVPYLVVSNGLTTFCCKMNYKTQSYDFLTEIPFFIMDN